MKHFLNLFFVFSLFSTCDFLNIGEFDGCDKSKVGSCYDVNVAFIAMQPTFTGKSVTQIDVTIDGEMLGQVIKFHSSTPSICSDDSLLVYTFSKKKQREWRATMQLEDGSSYFTNGTVYYGDIAECIIVNVTR